MIRTLDFVLPDHGEATLRGAIPVVAEPSAPPVADPVPEPTPRKRKAKPFAAVNALKKLAHRHPDEPPKTFHAR